MANGYWNSLLDRIFEKKILVILIVMFLVLVLTLIFELNPYKSAPEETMEDFTSDFRLTDDGKNIRFYADDTNGFKFALGMRKTFRDAQSSCEQTGGQLVHHSRVEASLQIIATEEAPLRNMWFRKDSDLSSCPCWEDSDLACPCETELNFVCEYNTNAENPLFKVMRPEFSLT